MKPHTVKLNHKLRQNLLQEDNKLYPLSFYKAVARPDKTNLVSLTSLEP